MRVSGGVGYVQVPNLQKMCLSQTERRFYARGYYFMNLVELRVND